MQIINQTPSVTYSAVSGNHILDFGNVSFNSHAAVTLHVQGTNIKDFKATVTCGCTLSEVVIINDNLVSVTIQYKNTNHRSTFAKSVIFTFKENGAQKKETVKIKGTVK